MNEKEKNFVYELHEEARRTRHSKKRLNLHKARLIKECNLRLTMLEKHEESCEKAINEIKRGNKVLFSIEETYSTAPNLQKLIANPSRGML